MEPVTGKEKPTRETSSSSPWLTNLKSQTREKDAKENKQHDPSVYGFSPAIPSRTKAARSHSVLLLSLCRQSSDFCYF